MTHTADKSGNRQTIRILSMLLVLVLIAVLAVAVFGLPALGLLGLAMTAAFFAVMLVFIAGN